MFSIRHRIDNCPDLNAYLKHVPHITKLRQYLRLDIRLKQTWKHIFYKSRKTNNVSHTLIPLPV